MMNAFCFWLSPDRNFKFLFLTLLPNFLEHSSRGFLFCFCLFVVVGCLFVWGGVVLLLLRGLVLFLVETGQ